MQRFLTYISLTDRNDAEDNTAVTSAGSKNDLVVLLSTYSTSLSNDTHSADVYLFVRIPKIIDFLNLLGRVLSDSTEVRYDTIDDLHWKTDRQAASLFIYLFINHTVRKVNKK